MKRWLCLLLSLCLLLGCALCEEELDNAYDGEDEWTDFESRFGFTLWYQEDLLSAWTEDFCEETAEWFCPWEDESGVAALICRGSRYSAMMWDDATRMMDFEGPSPYLGYPYEITAYTDGEIVWEQWIVSAPDRDFVFILQYEAGDAQGWAPLFYEVLETIEFPFQPAGNASFRLDFFQGGAAGMRFIPVRVDPDAEPMVLMPLEEVTDFALESLDWEEWEYTATPLCVADILSPGTNLLIYSYIPDTLPNLSIRYVDSDGQPQRWFISQSGRDGSLLLIAEDDL